MQSSVHAISPVLCELTFEFPWDHVRNNIESDLQSLRKQAKIRGYRPGKAPEHVVRQLYAKQVNARVVGKLFEEGFYKAIHEHDLDVVATPETPELPELKKGSALCFKTKLEVTPAITQVKLDGLNVERVQPETITDEDIDKDIERTRRDFSERRALDTARPAQQGDELTVDLKAFSQAGEPIDKIKSTDQRLVLDTAFGTRQDFIDALVGASIDETRQVDVQYDNDIREPLLRNQHIRYEVVVKDIKEVILPELDDDFAKDVEGDYETILEMRLDIRKRYETSSNSEAEEQTYKRIIDALLASNPIDLPPSVVASRFDELKNTAKLYKRWSQEGDTLSEDEEREIEEQARQSVHTTLVLRALIKEHNLTISAADIDAELSDTATLQKMPLAQVRAQMLGDKRTESQLKSRLLDQNVRKFLEERATIRDPEAKTTE